VVDSLDSVVVLKFVASVVDSKILVVVSGASDVTNIDSVVRSVDWVVDSGNSVHDVVVSKILVVVSGDSDVRKVDSVVENPGCNVVVSSVLLVVLDISSVK